MTAFMQPLYFQIPGLKFELVIRKVFSLCVCVCVCASGDGPDHPVHYLINCRPTGLSDSAENVKLPWA